MYRWDFTPVVAHADLLAAGLVNTLKLSATALAFGIPLGLVLALMRLARRRSLAIPAGFVIEFFRTTPPLVQLFWFFFALPILIHVEMTPFVAAALTFSIQSAAFFAEVFRAGIVSIERGQWEAAQAIGMDRAQALRTAFDAAHRDPQYIADAAAVGVEISPVGAEQLAQSLDKMAGASPEILDYVRKLLAGDKGG